MGVEMLLILGLCLCQVGAELGVDRLELIDNVLSGGILGVGSIGRRLDLDRTTGMVTMVGEEWGDLRGGVLCIVVGKLCERQ